MQYKFRGKRKDNGEWVYGSLIEWPDGSKEIVVFDGTTEALKHSVVPETVGQWTRMQDKHGNEIYNGDYVLWDERPAVIEYDVRMAGYYAMWKGEGVQFHNMQRINPEHGGLLHISVIDNIHDNPELVNPADKTAKI